MSEISWKKVLVFQNSGGSGGGGERGGGERVELSGQVQPPEQGIADMAAEDRVWWDRFRGPGLQRWVKYRPDKLYSRNMEKTGGGGAVRGVALPERWVCTGKGPSNNVFISRF